MSLTELTLRLRPPSDPSDSWNYAEIAVSSFGDQRRSSDGPMRLEVTSHSDRPVQVRRVRPTIDPVWTDTAVSLARPGQPPGDIAGGQRFVVRARSPGTSSFPFEVQVRTADDGVEAVRHGQWDPQQKPDRVFRGEVERYLAEIRLIDLLHELVVASRRHPRVEEVRSAAWRAAHDAGRGDVAAALDQWRERPDPSQLVRILGLASTPGGGDYPPDGGRRGRSAPPLPPPDRPRSDGSGSPTLPRIRPSAIQPSGRASGSEGFAAPVRRRPTDPTEVRPVEYDVDPIAMTTEMEALSEETQKRRTVDHTLARFSKVHDELRAEERHRRARGRKLLPWSSDDEFVDFDELDELQAPRFPTVEQPEQSRRDRRRNRRRVIGRQAGDAPPPSLPASATRQPRRPVPAPGAGPVVASPSTVAVVVNTGFADPAALPDVCSPDLTLVVSKQYLFWMDIAPLVEDSIERSPTALPAELPRDAVVAVVIFGFPEEITVQETATVGYLRLRPGQAATVVRQPVPVNDARWSATRLAFPVRMPAQAGSARLRCNVYWNQLLLQSRLIEVLVTGRPRTHSAALRSVLDFRIADPTPALAQSDSVSYAASLHLDEGASGTHELRVVADGGGQLLRAEATIGEGQLGTQITLARSALQRVAWGSDDGWHDGLTYRYGGAVSREQFAHDLISLAVNGYRLYHLLVRSLAQSARCDVYQMTLQLRAALARPGYVQIALRQAAQYVLPAALLYDLPLDTQAPELRLCADFERAVVNRQVQSADCFHGQCRQAREPDDTVVCPGGFWGYRHALGLPVSVGAAAGLPTHLDARAGGSMTGGLYRDFQLVDQHHTALRGILPDLDIHLAEDRQATLQQLRFTQPHIVYFYCHGGVNHAVPYLRVGTGTRGPVITPDNLFHHRIRWDRHRPLVFLNGCRTTGLTPENAINFVSFFVQDAWSCGVIGTEITVFEPLATTFAEECLRGFLTHGLPIGLAVRQARIALLAHLNPLGLAYVPFVLPTIHFIRQQRFEWFAATG